MVRYGEVWKSARHSVLPSVREVLDRIAEEAYGGLSSSGPVLAFSLLYCDSDGATASCTCLAPGASEDFVARHLEPLGRYLDGNSADRDDTETIRTRHDINGNSWLTSAVLMRKGGEEEGGSSFIRRMNDIVRERMQRAEPVAPASAAAAQVGESSSGRGGDSLLLRHLTSIDKSADIQTLRFTVTNCLRELFGGQASHYWWNVDSGHRSLSLVGCDLPVKSHQPTIFPGDANRILTEALKRGKAPTAVMLPDNCVPGFSGNVFAVLLGNGQGVTDMVVAEAPPVPGLNHPDTLLLNILAVHASARRELVLNEYRIDVESRISGVISSLVADRKSIIAPKEMLDELLSAFPEVGGAVHAFRTEGGSVCSYSFRQGHEGGEGKLLPPEFASPAAHSYGSISKAKQPAEWEPIEVAFGGNVEGFDRCTFFTDVGANSSSLLIFPETPPENDACLAPLGRLLPLLNSLEKGSSISARHADSAALASELVGELQDVKFFAGPAELAASFTSVIASLADAEFARVYSYDEAEGLLTAVEKEEGQVKGKRSVTAQEFNALSSSSQAGGKSFVTFASDAYSRLRDIVGLGAEYRSVIAAGIMDDGSPRLLLVCAYAGHLPPSSAGETMLQAGSLLHDLMRKTHEMQVTLGNSKFGSEFLSTISQALRSREGKWSFEPGHITDRVCSLAGSALLQDSAVLSIASALSPAGSQLGRWSRPHLELGSASEEISSILKSYAPHQEQRITGRQVIGFKIDDENYPVLHSCGSVLGTVIRVGGGEGSTTLSLVLIGSTGRPPAVSETATVSAALEATRLVLESRQRREDIDWTLDAMRSELGIARTLSSTFDTSALISETVREMRRFLKCDACLVELIDERGSCYIAAIDGAEQRFGVEECEESAASQDRLEERSRGFSTIAVEASGSLSLKGERACEEALSLLPQRKAELIRRAMAGKKPALIFGTPISFAGKLLGLVICMNASGRELLNRGEVNYLESVSALASTSIENSRNVEATFNALSKLRKLDTLRSNFSSIAAHELRTPLTSIRVYIELMKMGKVGTFTEQEKRNIDNLLASISELTEIINNMLEFTRMEAMLLETEMSPVALQPLMEEICALMSPVANAKSIRLEMDLSSDAKKVSANAPLIKRVINNLIGNAVKFTPEGGRISVSLKDDREGVLIRVEDTGKGIAAEDLPFIFDRFHVVDSSILHSRTGFRLGLPISKLIVERHGGRIWADSELGKGSKFYVLLPVKHGISTEDWLSEATGYIH